MKILVGYDGSDLAKKALKLAQEHARAFHAEIVHVLHSKVTDLPKRQQELEERDMDDVRHSMAKEGVVCETHLLTREWDPAHALVDFAADHDIDVIFIGVKKRSKVGKLIMGSTAQQVILEAPCPVISVR
jgi:nucleotide-binding universal stress UspA family protein